MSTFPRLALSLAIWSLPTAALGAPAPSDRGRPEVADVPWTLAEPSDPTERAPEPPPVSVTGTGTAPTAPRDRDAVAPAAAPSAPAPSPLRPRREIERMSEKPIGKGKVKYKPGRGLVVESDNGKYALAMNVAAQFLYTVQDQTPPAEGQKRTTNTFEIKRARMFLNGHVFSPHVKYWVQLQFSPRDLGLSNGRIAQSPAFQWQATFDWLRDFTPQIGLNFIPYARQRVAPIMKLQFVDNSIASYEFTLDRDIGITFMSKDVGGLGKLRYYVGAYMGEGYDFAKPTDFGLIYNARLEYLPFGDFEDYAEADLARQLVPKLSIGAAYAYSDNDTRNRALGSAPSDGGTTDSHNATVDVVFKVAGFSLLADAYYRFGRRKYGSAMLPPDDDGHVNFAPIELPRNGVGWTAQAGYLIPRLPFEIAARYSGIHRIGNLTSLHNTQEAGPGLSYYFAEHAVKVQLDYFHGWDETSWRSDRVRLQLTLGF